MVSNKRNGFNLKECSFLKGLASTNFLLGSSTLECSDKNLFWKKITGRNLRQSFFLGLQSFWKEATTIRLFCELCEIFKNSFQQNTGEQLILSLHGFLLKVFIIDKKVSFLPASILIFKSSCLFFYVLIVKKNSTVKKNSWSLRQNTLQ